MDTLKAADDTDVPNVGTNTIQRTAPNLEILQLNTRYALKTTHPITRAVKSTKKYYINEIEPHENHTGTE